MAEIKRIGILTGGGDAPGLNAAIKSVVYRAADYGIEVVGLFDGWRSVLNPLPETLTLTRDAVRHWDGDGGTHLGSSRTNPFKAKMPDGTQGDRSAEAVANIGKLGLDGIVACGGEDTLGVAARLSNLGVPVIAIPKTIDKDLCGTDYSLGFDTALRNVTEYIERSRTPAGSHGWVQIVEVMGRHAGHLALWSGVAGGADIILIPEVPFRYERIYELLTERMGVTDSHEHRDPMQPRYSVVVVAEGAFAKDGGLVTVDEEKDAFGHARLGGIGEELARHIRQSTPYDARAAMLGHPQRGGDPTPIDRLMGTLFGARAVEAIAGGEFGKLVSVRGIAPACDISLVEISEVLGRTQNVDVARYYDTEHYHMKNIGY